MFAPPQFCARLFETGNVPEMSRSWNIVFTQKTVFEVLQR